MILSERLTELLFPNEDPLGREVQLWVGQEGMTAEVIGIVGNMRERGLDIDPTAVWVAADCLAQQEWESGMSLVVGTVDCLSPVEFDIVLCNMIASNFLPLATDLRRLMADTGVAVFSGLLAAETEPVSLALEDAGFAVTSRHIDGDWASLTAVAATAP